jgi:hypothetical protein
MDTGSLIKKYIAGHRLSQRELTFLRTNVTKRGIAKQFSLLFPGKERRYFGRIANLLRLVGPNEQISTLSQKPKSDIESMHGRLKEHGFILRGSVSGGGANGTGKNR